LTLVELFKQRLTEQLDNKVDDVSSGCASDYADYRYRIGVIEGLTIAEREFSEILRNYEED
jgi:hypothetical protein